MEIFSSTQEAAHGTEWSLAPKNEPLELLSGDPISDGLVAGYFDRNSRAF
jgi:hypothetical protein